MTTENTNDSFLRPDDWMTGIIGKRAFHAIPGKNTIDLAYLDRQKPCFIDVKIDTRDAGTLRQFQQAGFELVDTNIQFLKPLTGKQSGPIQEVRAAVSSDEAAVRHIASTVFLSNRFHRDPKFDAAIASKIKEEWVGNFFRGKRGNALLVAELDGKIAGFILLLVDAAKKETIIDLVGVHADFQGLGVGKKLISGAEQWFGNEKIRVGTQLSNPASIFLYQKLGFTFESANYSLHLHL